MHFGFQFDVCEKFCSLMDLPEMKVWCIRKRGDQCKVIKSNKIILEENKMSKSEIGNQIFSLIEEVLNEESKKIKSFDDDISEILDSVGFVTLIVEIETFFDIEINDDDYEVYKINTINKLADLVETYMEKKN